MVIIRVSEPPGVGVQIYDTYTTLLPLFHQQSWFRCIYQQYFAWPTKKTCCIESQLTVTLAKCFTNNHKMGDNSCQVISWFNNVLSPLLVICLDGLLPVWLWLTWLTCLRRVASRKLMFSMFSGLTQWRGISGVFQSLGLGTYLGVNCRPIGCMWT